MAKRPPLSVVIESAGFFGDRARASSCPDYSILRPSLSPHVRSAPQFFYFLTLRGARLVTRLVIDDLSRRFIAAVFFLLLLPSRLRFDKACVRSITIQAF